MHRADDPGLRQCRSGRRGQGARSRIVAYLWRAQPEAARYRRPGNADGARRHRHLRSAEPGRRRRGEQCEGLDGTGKFAGIALLKPVIVAGPAIATPPAQAALVPADTVRDFLKTNGVNASGGSADAKSAVLR